MTVEEMEKIIEQMLGVQREIQESQLKLQESQLKLQESQVKLEESQERQARILNQLIGYSISAESGRLDLEEQLAALERRVRNLEQKP